MTTRSYPYGIDLVWLAADMDGRVAAFVTAGEGAVPDRALNSEEVSIDDIEMKVCSLPQTSNAQLLVAVPRPDDFIEMAERGFFVYDWSDVHRTLRDRINAYELVATPTKPLISASLPKDLLGFVAGVKFTKIRFSEQRTLDVVEYPDVNWVR